jgi:hypothetical protein
MRSLLVLLAVAVVLPAGASASSVRILKLQATISGTQDVAWHYQGDGWPAEDRIWALANGEQKLAFATTRSFPMQMVVANVPGHRSVSLVSVARSQPRLPARVSREQGWLDHAPKLCGGELGDCSTLQDPPPKVFDCAARDEAMYLTDLGGASADGPGVKLTLTATLSRPFDHCPPDQRDGGPVSALGPSQVKTTLDRSLAEVARLKPGKSMTLTGTRTTGLTPALVFKTSCPALKGAGYQECDTEKVTVVLKRRR